MCLNVIPETGTLSLLPIFSDVQRAASSCSPPPPPPGKDFSGEAFLPGFNRGNLTSVILILPLKPAWRGADLCVEPL